VPSSISMLNFYLVLASTQDEHCRAETDKLKTWCCRGWYTFCSGITNYKRFQPSFILFSPFLLAIMQILRNSVFLFHFKVWDATSADPKLLVFLKSYRNTVPVPRHWCQKRKFLQVRQHSKLMIMVLRCKHVWGLLVYLYVGCMNRVRKITSIWFLLYVCMWYLQGSSCGNHQAWNCRCLAMSSLESFIFYIFVIYLLYLC
jgi:hypothetical protein